MINSSFSFLLGVEGSSLAVQKAVLSVIGDDNIVLVQPSNPLAISWLPLCMYINTTRKIRGTYFCSRKMD